MVSVSTAEGRGELQLTPGKFKRGNRIAGEKWSKRSNNGETKPGSSGWIWKNPVEFGVNFDGGTGDPAVPTRGSEEGPGSRDPTILS